MTGKERDIFNRLRNDAGARVELWQQIVKNSAAMKKLVSEMDAYDKIHLMKAPLTLIHGSGDNVIPPSESLNLHYRMRELGKKSRLVVTPLISHGDILYPFRS
jgi:dipeptidyl aminopeptidase/acylaminoacyl peptidase